MQRLEVIGAVRPIYGSLRVKRLTELFIAMLPWSYNCVNVEVVMEYGRVLIDLAACGRWFRGTWRRRLCLCGIALSEGGGVV